ncbi:MAG: hypothetical protein RIS75_1112, partial [Actinomycetota bacterium]
MCEDAGVNEETSNSFCDFCGDEIFSYDWVGIEVSRLQKVDPVEDSWHNYVALIFCT